MDMYDYRPQRRNHKAHLTSLLLFVRHGIIVILDSNAEVGIWKKLSFQNVGCAVIYV